jgi:parallel beta-helix repeat protein
MNNSVAGIWVRAYGRIGIIGNNILNNKYLGGIRIESSFCAIVNNDIANNTVGVGLNNAEENMIYNNNFYENQIQSVLYVHGLVNRFDNGYPHGGNYWSDYNGTDLKSGPFQNETGYDWIGDTHYIIDENNTDHYPLMHPFVVETEEIRVAYRNLLSQYNQMYSDLETLNSTLYGVIGNVTDLQGRYNSLNATINDLQKQVDSLNSTYDDLQMQINSVNTTCTNLSQSLTDLQEQLDSLNSTLQTSINELQKQDDSINNQLNNVQNIMYVFIALTIVLLATTVYLATRKPKAKPET